MQVLLNRVSLLWIRLMNRGDLDRLTETQKLCLRHVYEHLTSKDIARLLDSSPHTVDTHIRSAQRILRVNSRFEAARMLHAFETGKKRTLSSASSQLVSAAPSVTVLSPPASASRESTNTSVRTKLLPLPDFWGDEHDLGNGAKFGWMVLCAIYICVSIGALLALMQAVETLFRD
jgi:DNA-binding CsgD family transcriptional regulator